MKLHPDLEFTTLDEFAECFEGVPKWLYSRLWGMMPETLPIPPSEEGLLYGEWPEPDHPNRQLFSRRWDEFNEEEQAIINGIAEANHWEPET